MKPAYTRAVYRYGIIQEIFPAKHFFGQDVVLFFADGTYTKVKSQDIPSNPLAENGPKFFVTTTVSSGDEISSFYTPDEFAATFSIINHSFSPSDMN